MISEVSSNIQGDLKRVQISLSNEGQVLTAVKSGSLYKHREPEGHAGFWGSQCRCGREGPTRWNRKRRSALGPWERSSWSVTSTKKETGSSHSSHQLTWLLVHYCLKQLDFILKHLGAANRFHLKHQLQLTVLRTLKPMWIRAVTNWLKLPDTRRWNGSTHSMYCHPWLKLP